MPVLFNTNRDATQGQLDNMFLGNSNLSPDQINSNLALSNPQGQDWINQQAQNLGIGDPVAHYNAIRLAQTMAQTQSGAQANANQMAGNWSADSLPGQLARRNAMVDQASAVNDQQSQQLASLQQQTNDHAYQLPTQGAPIPTLSPVMQAAMQQQGITNPVQFMMQQRLGSNIGAVDTKPLAQATGAINPDDLMNEPTFQAQLSYNPQRAAGVFTALTGQDFGSYAKNYAASKQQEHTSGIAFTRKALEEGTAEVGDDGNLRWRVPVQNPTSGQMVPGPQFSAGNHFQQSMNQYLPYVDTKLAQFVRLHNQGPGASAAPLPPPNVTATPPQLQSGDSTFANTMTGIGADLQRAFSGDADRMTSISTTGASPQQWAYGANDYQAPSGVTPTHARVALANNPRFQQLMKTNPVAARRVIMAIQMGGDTSPQAATAPTNPVGYTP